MNRRTVSSSELNPTPPGYFQSELRGLDTVPLIVAGQNDSCAMSISAIWWPSRHHPRLKQRAPEEFMLIIGMGMGMLGFALLLPGTIIDQPAKQGDQQQIHGVLNGFVDAWNHHDAKAFAAVFSEDADFTNVRGVSASGRSNIEEFHAPIFATIFKNTHQTLTEVKIRFIRPDIAAVDVHWNMTGVTDPQGIARPDRNGLLNFVMTKNAGRWQIVVMHNLDLTPLPPPPPLK